MDSVLPIDVMTIYYLLYNHSLIHDNSLLSCISISFKFLPGIKRAESSAYNKSLHCTAVSISLTYIKKCNGPRIDPCGTPHVMLSSSDQTDQSVVFYLTCMI